MSTATVSPRRGGTSEALDRNPHPVCMHGAHAGHLPTLLLWWPSTALQAGTWRMATPRGTGCGPTCSSPSPPPSGAPATSMAHTTTLEGVLCHQPSRWGGSSCPGAPRAFLSCPEPRKEEAEVCIAARAAPGALGRCLASSFVLALRYQYLLMAGNVARL